MAALRAAVPMTPHKMAMSSLLFDDFGSHFGTRLALLLGLTSMKGCYYGAAMSGSRLHERFLLRIGLW